MSGVRIVCFALFAIGCGPAEDAPAPIADEPRAAEYRSARVSEAIDAAAEVVETRGFAETEDAWRGFLVEHGSEVRELAMRTGTCWVVLAAASENIRELILRVFDSDGGAVVEDTANGPRAALRFCPSSSGTYYIAAQAAIGSGLFEVRTFRGPTGLEIRTDDLFRQVAPTEEDPPR
jgi:hypothetical protein